MVTLPNYTWIPVTIMVIAALLLSIPGWWLSLDSQKLRTQKERKWLPISLVVFLLGTTIITISAIYAGNVYIPAKTQEIVGDAYGIDITKGWQIRHLEERSPFPIAYRINNEVLEGEVIVENGKATVYSVPSGEPLPLVGNLTPQQG